MDPPSVAVFNEYVPKASVVRFLTPSAQLVAGFLDTVESPIETPVQVLTTNDALAPIKDDFRLATRLSGLLASEAADLRVTDDPIQNSLVVTDREIASVIKTNDGYTNVSAQGQQLVESIQEQIHRQWRAGSAPTIRIPPQQDLLDSLETEFNTDVVADFQELMEVVSVADIEAGKRAGVIVSLLTAARNDLLQYDISNWGQDIGLASVATFSRLKQDLLDAGIIETERVPIDVGRPRLRLTPAHEIPSDPDRLQELV